MLSSVQICKVTERVLNSALFFLIFVQEAQTGAALQKKRSPSQANYHYLSHLYTCEHINTEQQRCHPILPVAFVYIFGITIAC